MANNFLRTANFIVPTSNNVLLIANKFVLTSANVVPTSDFIARIAYRAKKCCQHAPKR